MKPETPHVRLAVKIGAALALGLVLAFGIDIARAGDAPKLSTIQQERARHEVLLSLESRLRQIEIREKDLDRREARLNEAADELKTKLAALEALRAELTALLANEKALKLKKYKDMARIHAAMPIARSAEILTSMDDETATRILGNLSRDRVAKTLAKMDPKRALQLSEAILDPKQQGR